MSPTYAKESLEGGAAGWLRATLAKPEVRAKFTVRGRCPLACFAQQTAVEACCSRPSSLHEVLFFCALHLLWCSHPLEASCNLPCANLLPAQDNLNRGPSAAAMHRAS